MIYTLIYILTTKNVDILNAWFWYERVVYIIIFPEKFFYHFWFIGLILSFYLFYPLLIKFLMKYQNRLLSILIISIVIQAIWIPIRNLLFIILLSIKKYFLVYNILFSLVFYSFLSYISYFLLGIYLSRVELKSSHYWLFIFPILILSFISFLFTIRYGYFLEIIFPLFFIPVIIIYFKLSRKIKKIKPILVLFGKYSFGIYLIHGAINLKMIEILYNNSITINNWVFYPLLFILTFSTSYLIAFSINLIPGSRYIIGKVREERIVQNFIQKSIIFEYKINNLK
ncbi:MAG: acyltransferase family protein [Candidatus Lokiarchaeota archaeon]|nr:acyltransferase family protein [Candidatus Lokiarchaeota archaeon]